MGPALRKMCPQRLQSRIKIISLSQDLDRSGQMRQARSRADSGRRTKGRIIEETGCDLLLTGILGVCVAVKDSHSDL